MIKPRLRWFSTILALAALGAVAPAVDGQVPVRDGSEGPLGEWPQFVPN